MTSSVTVWDIVFLVWLLVAMCIVFYGLTRAVLHEYDENDVLWNCLRAVLWPALALLWVLGGESSLTMKKRWRSICNA